MTAPAPGWSLDDLTATFGDRLRMARLASQMTQDDLAAKVGMTRSSIANTEADRQNISLSTACALADALGSTVGALLGEPDAPPRRLVAFPEKAIREVVEQVIERSGAKLARDVRSAIADVVRAAS